MKKSLIILFILFLFTACQEINENQPVLSNTKKKQPVIVVNKNRHFNIAEFWIDQIPNPDAIIMDEKQIKKFNDNVTYKQKRLTYFSDVSSQYGGSWVKSSIENMIKGITVQTKYFADGNQISNSFFNDIKNEIGLNNISMNKVKTRYAITVNYTNQKIVPTDLLLLKKKDQIHFDRNQNSALDIATPIAILHTTTDGQWHYGIAPTSSGWIKNSNIAFGDKKEINDYLESQNFIVTASAKSALNIGGHYHDYLRMGVRLPYLLTIDEMTMVLVPTRDKEGNLVVSNATIKTSDTHKGYLPYTPRNILNQAFKFINAPYGWGGMYGEQDCSKFLQEVYASIGIQLPRNSASQSDVGDTHLKLTSLNSKAKAQMLHSMAPVGSTIIHLKGHIVLYLGEYKGEPYIIHTVWGESNRHFALGRTAVTSLEFNNYINKIDRATIITTKESKK